MNQFDDVYFASNHDPTCPCILLLDTSASMSGAPIAALNEGLQIFHQDIRNDANACNRVEVAIVTFGNGGVQTVQEFTNITQVKMPTLTAGGNTPMGAAIEHALDLLRQRKNAFHVNAAPYYRPWVFLITDGAPTDSWQGAAERVHTEEKANALTFFAVGVGEADMSTLAQITTRQPLKLQGLKFTELFLWLSASQKRVSASVPKTPVPLPAPDGWAVV
jgi:uncharacterized protein YegL